MKSRQHNDEVWLYVKNEQMQIPASNYKLHVALPAAQFDLYQQNLFQLLKKAVEEGVIRQFKMANIGNTEVRRNLLGMKQRLSLKTKMHDG